jgi:Domain of unknown function (DUF4160)
VIRQYATDHPPLHVHVFRDGKNIAQVEIPSGEFMYLDGQYEKHRGRILAALETLRLT